MTFIRIHGCLLGLVAANHLETIKPCISFEMQGFFFGVILG